LKADNFNYHHRKIRMLKLSLDALQILDAIDRGGSFAAAAKELFRVPSTVSYAVAKLEEDLGVSVFERTGPRVTLTLAGKTLLDEGRHLLTAARHLEHKVRRVASGWEAEFTIGMDLLFSPMSFADDIRDFYQVATGTRLRFSHEALSGTWEALLDRRADLIVGAAGEGPSGGGYVTEPLGSIPFVFAVAPHHPLASVMRPLTRSDLLAHRVVSVADTALRLPTRTVGLLLGQDTLTVPSLTEKFAFQLAGLGMGYLPEPWVKEAIRAGKLVEKQVEEQRPPENFYLAWRTGEQGAALDWWVHRLRGIDLRGRLQTPPACI
jgi:DNA-binding transcriptional LysR family regulator